MAENSIKLPDSTEELREAALARAPTGPGTATGQAIGQEDEEIPSGKDRGSTVPIDGGEPKPDFEGGQEPRGLQAEPAVFTSNGSINPTMVPSPTGLVPVGLVAGDLEEASEAIEERFENLKHEYRTLPASRELSEAEIARLTAPELRAIALDRGYEVPEVGGSRTMRARFIAAQKEDDTLDRKRGKKAAEKEASRGSETAKSVGATAPQATATAKR